MIKFNLRSCLTRIKSTVKTFNIRDQSTNTGIYKEDKVQLGNLNINYLKVGQGAHKVLCLPGALGSIWTDFKPQIEKLDKDKFTLVAWDPPGYGKSRPPNKEFPVDFYEKDAHLAAKLMDAIKIDKYSLLGWSDGGITALILAANYPSNVEKLVVWGCNAFILPEEMKAYEAIRDVSKWSEKMRNPMIEMYGAELFPALWDKWTDAMKNICEMKKGDICIGELTKIKCPTLIIHGQKDPMIDNSHVSHLHTNITHSRIHLYPDGKHNVHLRYADDFNNRVTSFFIDNK